MERDCKRLSEVALEVFYPSQLCQVRNRQANQLHPNPALPPLVCSPTNASFYWGWYMNRKELSFVFMLQTTMLRNKQKEICFLLVSWAVLIWKSLTDIIHGTPQWNVYSAISEKDSTLKLSGCGKFAEQDMCRGRKLKHDGAISIQSLRKKMVFIFLMFLLNWQDDPFHLWLLS